MKKLKHILKNATSKLHVYVPQPLIFFLAFYLVYLVSSKEFIYPLWNFYFVSLGIMFFIGLVFYLGGGWFLFTSKTSLLPMFPDSARKIVKRGLYKFTRNPIYLGEAILLFTFAMYLKTFYGLLILFVFTLYITQFQIKPEELALREKFGKTYVEYCAKVRRWI